MDGLYLEGNNGGDIFIIESMDDGRIHLKVGHCCVYEIDHIVPVEFLTAVLVNVVIRYGGVDGAFKGFANWDSEFMESLTAKMERAT